MENKLQGKTGNWVILDYTGELERDVREDVPTTCYSLRYFRRDLGMPMESEQSPPAPSGSLNLPPIGHEP